MTQLCEALASVEKKNQSVPRIRCGIKFWVLISCSTDPIPALSAKSYVKYQNGWVHDEVSCTLTKPRLIQNGFSLSTPGKLASTADFHFLFYPNGQMIILSLVSFLSNMTDDILNSQVKYFTIWIPSIINWIQTYMAGGLLFQINALPRQ